MVPYQYCTGQVKLRRLGVQPHVRVRNRSFQTPESLVSSRVRSKEQSSSVVCVFLYDCACNKERALVIRDFGPRYDVKIREQFSPGKSVQIANLTVQ